MLTATVEGTITDYGTAANKVTGYVVKRGETDVTANYTFGESVDGELGITKRTVTLKSADLEKVYDGIALVNGETALETETGWVEGEGASYTFTGSQLDPDVSANAFDYTLNANTKAENYTISKSEGTLTVNRKAVTITANNASRIYNGSALTEGGFTAGALEIGDNHIFTVAMTEGSTITDFGTQPNVIATVDGIAMTTGVETEVGNYLVTTADGELEISKRSVTLTSASDSKQYDKKALMNSTVTETGDGFITGEGATYTVTGTQTVAGDSKNSFTYTLKEGTKAENYAITKVEGTLNVTPITDKVTVTITEHSGSEKYDGTEKTVTEYDFRASNTLYTEDDCSFSGDATVKGTDAGSYAMELKTADFANTNDNFKNVEFEIVDGTLEISKRTVTLTSATDSKEYDGTALTNDTVTVTGDGFAEREGATYTVTGTQTVAGSSENTFTYALNEGTKDGNYNISRAFGTLTVTNRGNLYEITVAAAGETRKYNGEEQSTEGNGLVTTTFEVEGNTYTVEGLSASATGKDAGTYAMNVVGTPIVRDSARNDVTTQFKVYTENSDLVITKRSVTLTSADDSKQYDKTALTNSNVTVTGDGFVDSEGATYTVTGSRTEEGSSPNAFTYALNEGTKADNYEISKVEGTLTVTPITDLVTVTITENGGEVKYDGKVHTMTDYGFSSSNTLYTTADFSFNGDATVKGTDAGSYEMNLKAEDFTNTNQNFKNVEFVIVDNTLEISKRTVTLTSADDSKQYDKTALTNSNVTVTGDGFVEGEGATYNVTGTRTEEGTSPNAFTYALKAGTKADNYEISTVEGTLTIAPITDKVTVTITEHGGEVKYDGKVHTVTGYEFGTDNDLYTTADFSFNGDATVNGIDAGSYGMELKAEDFVNTNTNFKNVEFVIVDKTLEISKRSVKLTSADASKQYDRNELTNSTVTVTGDGFVAGEGATYDVTGSRTEEGSSPNAFTYALKEGTKAENYEISKVEGTLTVTPITDKVTVTITEHSGSAKYDGSEKTVTGYDFSTSNKLYKEADFTFSGDAAVKGIDAGNYPMELKAVDFTNTNDNFKDVEFVIVDGTLEISKRSVTLTSASDSKQYDKTALTNSTVTETGDGFITGEGATYTVTGTQTVAGDSKNSFTYTLKEGTKAENYAITKVEGTLNVTPITDKVTVTITEHSGSEKYDGTEKTVTEYDFRASNTLYTEDDCSFSGDATVKGTDAGSYAMELKTADFANTNDNFKNVEFEIVDGTLEISKREVRLTSATDSKEYDGTALTNDTVTVTGDGFITGEGATYTVTGTQTVAGNSENTFTYVLNDGTKDGNYNVSRAFGTLTVTNRETRYEITVAAAGETRKYNGEEQSTEGNGLVTTTFEVEGNTYTVEGLSASATGKDAGTYPMNVVGTPVVKDSAGNDVTTQFKVNTDNSELIISKRSVTLTSATDSKQYDKTALTNSNVAITGDGFVDGEGATYTVTGSRTEEGSSPNAFTYALNEGTKAGNYEISKVEGTLTVTPITDLVTVTITENGGEVKYDGKVHTMTDYGFSSSNTLYTTADFSFNGDATVKGTDAGSYEMNLKAEDFTNTNQNFKNVEFVIVDNTLEISKRTVTLTSADDSKQYDKTALTNSNVTVTGDGFVEGEGATYNVTGTRTEEGTSPNAFTYALKAGTKADNYEISTVEGTLTIAPITDKVTVTITEHGGEVKYDGKVHTVTGYEFGTDNDLYTTADFSFNGDATVNGIDAGSYGMELKAEDFTNTNDNFKNVEFKIVDNTLEISKRAVTLTSATDSKQYDGVALMNSTVMETEDGFIDGEGAAYTVTGSQTEADSSANTFTYTLNEGTKADNYEISTVEGTLTVTPVADKVTVTITEHSGSELYDGAEKTVTGYTVTAISNKLYKEADFTFSGDATVKGINAGTYPMGLKSADFSNISKNFSNVEFAIVDGSLSIGKRTVNLASETASKVYDGTALTRAVVTVDGDGFVEGEVTDIKATGSVTTVAESPVTNTITYTEGEKFNADNYTIAKDEGTLTITAADISNDPFKVSDPAETMYNGEVQEQTVTITYGEDETVLDAENYDVTYSEDTTNAGTVTVTVTGKDNYTGTVVKTYVIKKRTVNLESETATKVYDGTALTRENVTVTGDGFVEGEVTDIKATGSVTNVAEGTVTNTITYTTGEKFNANNYTINKTEGTLTITGANISEAPFKVSEPADTMYNGEAQEQTVIVTYGDLDIPLDAENYDVTYSEDTTNAGTVTVTVTGKGNYTGTVQKTYEIAKRTVNLASETANKVYDGTALTRTNVETTGDGFVEGEVTGIMATGSATTVAEGSVTNTITYTTGEKFNANNYTINKNEGTLTITPKPVTLTIEASTKTYGDKDPDLTASFAEGDLVGNDLVVYTLSRTEGENVGEYPIQVAINNNPNYKVDVVNGKALTIEPKAVTVKADNKLKTYGDADPTLTAKVTGLLDGESEELIKYTLNRTTGNDVGKYTITATGEAKQGNYTVTYEPGELEIVTLDTVVVRITANGGAATYDGTAKTASGYTVDFISNPLFTANDIAFNGANELTRTNAGTYARGLSEANFTSGNGNFNNVRFEVTDASLVIGKRNVTLTSGDGAKTYDGTALVVNTVTVGGDGFAEGEGVNTTVTGRQTEVGKSENKFNYTLKDGTLADNYNVTTTFGTLTVNGNAAGNTVANKPLVIHYVYSDGRKAANDHNGTVAIGQTYKVESPAITGYTPDTKTVEGTMPAEGVAETTVTYTLTDHVLTIRLVDYTDHSVQLGETITVTKKYNETYSVEIPEIEGYSPMGDITKVEGIMPDKDLALIVWMLPDTLDENDPARKAKPITIDDYGTPLGIAESILGNGEIIE